MKRADSAITEDQFKAAQEAELANWASRAGEAEYVRDEMAEHSEVIGPLRRVAGAMHFEQGLEVGIGPFGLGFLAVHFADRVRQIDGLDPLPRLKITVQDQELQGRVNAIQGSVRPIQSCAESIPAESESYDIVSCINVVDHARDPGKIILEIARVLRPGGLLVFSVSTLSWAGEHLWRYRRGRRPSDWLFKAHPHTFQWRDADELVGRIPGETLWCDRPGLIQSLAGHGKMSSWIRKSSKK
jgi:2-polyprenyl-3-methyl-5-hydroxy-6-metoxy-1,4-benzoquinol methylase